MRSVPLAQSRRLQSRRVPIFSATPAFFSLFGAPLTNGFWKGQERILPDSSSKALFAAAVFQGSKSFWPQQPNQLSIIFLGTLCFPLFFLRSFLLDKLFSSFNIMCSMFLRCRFFFPKALRRFLPENLLKTDTSTLTLEHLHFYMYT